MAFVTPGIPNLTDFTTFVYGQGVTVAQLPSTSVYLTYAFNKAFAIVPTVPQMDATLYTLAVYYYGMHRLLEIAQDQVGQTFFTKGRQTYGLLNLVIGPVISSSDNGTSQSLAQPDFLSGLQMGDLSLIKTFWGREYLDYAMTYGPNIVGVS